MRAAGVSQARLLGPSRGDVPQWRPAAKSSDTPVPAYTAFTHYSVVPHTKCHAAPDVVQAAFTSFTTQPVHNPLRNLHAHTHPRWPNNAHAPVDVSTPLAPWRARWRISGSLPGATKPWPPRPKQPNGQRSQQAAQSPLRAPPDTFSCITHRRHARRGSSCARASWPCLLRWFGFWLKANPVRPGAGQRRLTQRQLFV